MKNIDKKEFEADAAAGMSTNALAKKHGITWAEAKTLRGLGIPDSPGETTESAPEEAAAFYDLALSVPTDRLLDLIRGAEPDDLMAAIEKMDHGTQATLVQSILQVKIDQILTPRNIDTSAAIALMPQSGAA